MLAEIRSDPGWYLNILWQRLSNILTTTSAVSFSWGNDFVSTSFSGWWTPLTLLLLLLRRKWFLAGIIAFTFPLSATALFIFNFRGTTLYNIYHLMTFAVWLYLLAHSLATPGGSLYWRKWVDSTIESFRHRDTGPRDRKTESAAALVGVDHLT